MTREKPIKTFVSRSTDKVYEINKRTGKVIGIREGVDHYFRRKMEREGKIEKQTKNPNPQDELDEGEYLVDDDQFYIGLRKKKQLNKSKSKRKKRK